MNWIQIRWFGIVKTAEPSLVVAIGSKSPHGEGQEFIFEKLITLKTVMDLLKINFVWFRPAVSNPVAIRHMWRQAQIL
jgi:hypothetical protein